MLFNPTEEKKSMKVTPHRLEKNNHIEIIYRKKSNNHIEMYLISLNSIEDLQ